VDTRLATPAGPPPVCDRDPEENIPSAFGKRIDSPNPKFAPHSDPVGGSQPEAGFAIHYLSASGTSVESEGVSNASADIRASNWMGPDQSKTNLRKQVSDGRALLVGEQRGPQMKI
jgi:hypothetical protein